MIALDPAATLPSVLALERPRAPSRWWIVLGICAWLLGAMTLLPTAIAAVPAVNDFNLALYPAGQAILARRSPYTAEVQELQTLLTAWNQHQADDQLARSSMTNDTGFAYPPALAVVMAPFGALPLTVAKPLWMLLELGCVLAAAIAAGRQLAPPSWRWIVSGVTLAMFAGFAPLRYVLLGGQADLPILLAMVLSLPAILSSRRSQWRDILAGALLGMAATFKLYPAAFLGVALLRRQWTVLIAALATVLLLTAPAVVAVGPAILVDYVRLDQLGSQPALAGYPFGWGMLQFAYRALTPTPFAVPLLHLTPGVVKAIYGVAAVSIAGVVLWLCARDRFRWSALHIACVGIASLVAFPALEVMHLPLLLAVLPPFGATVVQRFAETGAERLRLVIVLLALLGLTLLLTAGALVLPQRTMAYLSGLLSVAGFLGVAGGLSRVIPSPRVRWSLALLAATYLLLASWSLLNMSAWWPVPLSPLHVIAGEGQLYELALLGVAVALITSAGTARNFAAPVASG